MWVSPLETCPYEDYQDDEPPAVLTALLECACRHDRQGMDLALGPTDQGAAGG